MGGDCGSNLQQEELPDRICEISESCSQMVVQFHNQIEVNLILKFTTTPLTPPFLFMEPFAISTFCSLSFMTRHLSACLHNIDTTMCFFYFFIRLFLTLFF